jgi:hypothetical protein
LVVLAFLVSLEEGVDLSPGDCCIVNNGVARWSYEEGVKQLLAGFWLEQD